MDKVTPALRYSVLSVINAERTGCSASYVASAVGSDEESVDAAIEMLVSISLIELGDTRGRRRGVGSVWKPTPLAEMALASTGYDIEARIRRDYSRNLEKCVDTYGLKALALEVLILEYLAECGPTGFEFLQKEMGVNYAEMTAALDSLVTSNAVTTSPGDTWALTDFAKRRGFKLWRHAAAKKQTIGIVATDNR